MSRVSLALLLASLASAQTLSANQPLPPLIQWQQTLGGTAFDLPTAMVETADGGFVFGATSASGLSGNKTSPSHDTNVWNGDYFQPNVGDYWLVKLDAKGSKLWDRSFGFGNLDQCSNLQQLPDGGFLLSGFSVSSNRLTSIPGVTDERDTWLVRTDANGSELWNYRFIELGLDEPLSVLSGREGELLVVGFGDLAWVDDNGSRLPAQLPSDLRPAFFQSGLRTSDQGLILSGISYRASETTEQPVIFPDSEIWLGRYNADGAERWQRTYGGLGFEGNPSTKETEDGGFLVVGTSDSPPDENKTSPLLDGPNPDPDFGIFRGDVWVFRTDADGNKLWERSFGTERADWPALTEPTPDGGALLLWWSLSPNSPELRIHLTRIDSSGDTLWSHNEFESGAFFSRIIQLPDGGFLLGGSAPAGTNALKSDPGYGFNDCWLLRFDANGVKLWDMALGGSGDDILRTIGQTKDGGFILGIMSTSGADGNKTTPGYGDYDLWAVKLGPEPPPDSDGDGVSDDRDKCPVTAPGEIVDANGCSIEQLCPCAGPWKNHGEYISRLSAIADRFKGAGLISTQKKLELIRQAAASDCGE